MEKYDEIVLAWKNQKLRSAAELEAALNGYVIQFAYHSGKIENPQITYNDTQEIFDHDGVTNYTGDVAPSLNRACQNMGSSTIFASRP